MFDYQEVATVIKEEFGPAWIETLRRDIVFFDLAYEGAETYEEKDIQEKINYSGNSSVGSFSENAAFGTAGEQAYTTARWDWKLNKAVVRVSGLAQAVSKSPNSIIDAIAQETESALKDLRRNMNLQLLSDGMGNLNAVGRPELDSTGLDLTGIQAAIDDGSAVSVYGNIDRTSNTWWRSFVLDNGGVNRQLTEELMTQVTNEITIRGGKVTHILCSPTTWSNYGFLLKQERRQVNPGQTLYGGFRTLDFQGIPVISVPDYEENKMDFIDKENAKMKVLRDFSVEPRDPGNHDAAEFFIKTYSQFVYLNPWHAGSLRDIV